MERVSNDRFSGACVVGGASVSGPGSAAFALEAGEQLAQPGLVLGLGELLLPLLDEPLPLRAAEEFLQSLGKSGHE